MNFYSLKFISLFQYVLIGKKLPPNVDPLGVFANDDIDLGEIDVYGFDYDYTLATYRTDVEQLIHHCAKQALVDKFKVVLVKKVE